MSLSDDDRKRRLAAKRNNERVKIFANLLNALSIATFGATIILPAFKDGLASFTSNSWIWIFVGFGLHTGAHLTFRLMKSED